MRLLKIFSLLFAMSSPVWLLAQTGYSPYTLQGLGERHKNGVINNQAMGGIGIGTASSYFLNTVNPALLPVNYLTVFEIGISGEYRDLTDDNTTASVGGASLSYLAAAFPIFPQRWTMSVGLEPYSSVNYQIDTEETFETTNALVRSTLQGEGGISQAYMGHGVRFLKNFYAGVRVNFLFGSITDQSIVDFTEDNINANFITAVFERNSFRDVQLRTGLSYRAKLNETTDLRLGLIYDLGSEMNVERFQSLERRSRASEVLELDTLVSGEESTLSVPQGIGFGFSFDKDLKWKIGADIFLQESVPFRGNEQAAPVQRLRIGLGGEITPDLTAVKGYFKRVTYRLGVSYERTPFSLDGNTVNDFGINFGLTLPIPNSAGSGVNLAFLAGQRDVTGQNAVREAYFGFSFGATFNDRWFIKRKYD